MSRGFGSGYSIYAWAPVLVEYINVNTIQSWNLHRCFVLNRIARIEARTGERPLIVPIVTACGKAADEQITVP